MEEWEGFREGDRVVCRHRVRYRVGEFLLSFPLGTNPRVLTRCGFANSLLSLRFHSFTRNVLPIDLNVLRISLYAQYRARNDIGNAVAAGFIAGGVLARNTGPKGALWGGLGFAAFSAAIDLFLRRETPE